jgi:ATP/maltotriose-dependent transcriptional regulator MalT
VTRRCRRHLPERLPAGRNAGGARRRAPHPAGPVGNRSAARRNFEASQRARRDSGRDMQICQSLINLARLEVADGGLETAARYADEVIATLRGTPPSGLHANAEALVAQVRLRQSRPGEGIPYAERALALNRQLANRRGEPSPYWCWRNAVGRSACGVRRKSMRGNALKSTSLWVMSGVRRRRSGSSTTCPTDWPYCLSR